MFLISDFFFSEDFWKPLTILARRHDVISLVVRDDYEIELPVGRGRIRLGNPESGDSWVVNTANKVLVGEINEALRKEREELFRGFVRSGVDSALITPSSGWLKPMLALFRRRERRR